jgi:hypothetical protein
VSVAYPEIFLGGRGSINSVEDRGNGDLGLLAPSQRFHSVNETHILTRLLPMYFPRNWEFDSALSKLLNFGGGGGVPKPPPLGTPITWVPTIIQFFQR